MLRIGEAREARGWTQTQLAEALGTTQQTIQRWESGIVDPKVSQVMEVSKALGITVSFLLGMDEKQPEASKPPLLSENEIKLLALYRSMDPDGCIRLMEQAEFLAARHPKNQAHSMGA